MTNQNNSGVVYIREFSEVSSSITYIDPKNPPRGKALILRSFLESCWCLLFSFLLVPMLCVVNGVLRVAGFFHLPTVVVGFVGLLLTYGVFLPLYLLSAKDTRKQFIKAGGDATGFNLFMFIGMLPTGKSHWQRYQFLLPADRKRVIASAQAKPVTGPFF